MSEESPGSGLFHWLRKFYPALALVAVGVMVGVVAVAWIGHDDSPLRRWATLDDSVPRTDFQSLLSPQPKQKAIPAKATDWGEPHVSVYTFAAAQKPSPTLRDLTDSGLGHAIDFLAKNTPTDPHTWRQLDEALANGQSPDATASDPFKFDRVLVSTVTRGAMWREGDRMVWTRVFVQPINFEFGDYFIQATQNESDTIAEVEDTQSRKMGGDLSLGALGAEGPKAELTPSNESSTKTTQSIGSQYEKLGVDIQRNFLRVIKESGRYGDVAGNALVPLSMTTDPATIHKQYPEDPGPYKTNGKTVLLVTATQLTDENGRDPAGKDTAAITAVPQAVLPHCPLRARIWMLYEEREILRGREFYDEARQEAVVLHRADARRDVEVVPADDVSPAVWTLKVMRTQDDDECKSWPADGGAAVDNSGRPVTKIEILQGTTDNQGVKRDIVFTDYGQARAMAHWLRIARTNRIGTLTMCYDRGDSLLPFKETQLSDDCQHAPTDEVPSWQINKSLYEVKPPERDATAQTK